MARTKQTAHKHTDGGANVGRKAKKTRLARALKASDKRLGVSKAKLRQANSREALCPPQRPPEARLQE